VCELDRKNGVAGSNLNPVGFASCSHNPGHVAGLQKTSLSMWLAEFVFRYSGIRIGVSGNIPSPGDGFSSGILGTAANRTKRSGLAFLVLARSTIITVPPAKALEREIGVNGYRDS
jgi:hypothetical protein